MPHKTERPQQRPAQDDSQIPALRYPLRAIAVAENIKEGEEGKQEQERSKNRTGVHLAVDGFEERDPKHNEYDGHQETSPSEKPARYGIKEKAGGTRSIEEGEGRQDRRGNADDAPNAVFGFLGNTDTESAFSILFPILDFLLTVLHSIGDSTDAL